MARNIFILLGALLIVTLLQVFAFSRLTVLHTAPDAMAVFIAFSAVTLGRNAGMGFGFLGGMLYGLITGDMGLHMLGATLGGFAAGGLHVPRDSHATPGQKMRRIYAATAVTAFTAHTVFSIGADPLGLPLLYRIAVLGPLETLLTLALALAANLLILKNAFSD